MLLAVAGHHGRRHGHGRLLLAAAPEAGPAGMALDLLSIIVAAVEQAPGMAVRGIDSEGDVFEVAKHRHADIVGG